MKFKKILWWKPKNDGLKLWVRFKGAIWTSPANAFFPPIFPKTKKVGGSLSTLFGRALKTNPQSI